MFILFLSFEGSKETNLQLFLSIYSMNNPAEYCRIPHVSVEYLMMPQVRIHVFLSFSSLNTSTRPSARINVDTDRQVNER